MIYQVNDGTENFANIEADNDEDAWKQLKKAGIRNKGKTLQLVEID